MSEIASSGVFGRTGETVARVWHERPDGSIDAGDWTGLIVTAADLDRRGGDRVRERVALLGRPFDFVVTRGLVAGDLKIGWPLHRLQRFRDEKLLRYVVIETDDVLEAEWIAANAPVHGVAIVYEPNEMSARFRVFDAAKNAGVTLIGHAETPDAVALQLATPQITSTLLAPHAVVSATLSPADAEAMWDEWTATHAEPPRLRGAHPPEYGS